MLERLKRRLGAAVLEQDSLLGDLLLDAEALVKAYTARERVPQVLASAVVELAAAAYHHLGLEGESNHTEGGVSAGIDGLPKHLKDMLGMYRLGKVGD